MAITLPIGIRVAAGLLGTVIDRLTKLPEDLTKLPGELPALGVTLAGQLVKTSLRVRQEVAELVTRGDDLLSPIIGGAQENPPWATFDEDEDRDVGGDSSAFDRAPESDPDGQEASFDDEFDGADVAGSLDDSSPAPAATTAEAGDIPVWTSQSTGIPDTPSSGTSPTGTSPTGTPASDTQASAAGVDLADGRSIGPDHTLSVAQLKERLLAVDLPVVTALLAQEEAGPRRAAYLTLLSNRVTTLQHEHR